MKYKKSENKQVCSFLKILSLNLIFKFGVELAKRGWMRIKYCSPTPEKITIKSGQIEHGWERNYCGSEGEGGGSYFHLLYCDEFGLLWFEWFESWKFQPHWINSDCVGMLGGHNFIIPLSLLNLIQEQLFDHSPLWPIIQCIGLTWFHPFSCIHSLSSFSLLISHRVTQLLKVS